MSIRIDAVTDVPMRSASVPNIGPLTVCGWIKSISDLNSSGPLFARYSNNTGTERSGLYIDSNGDGVHAEATASSGDWSTVEPLTRSAWQFWAYRRNGNNVDVLLTGAVVRSCTGTPAADTVPSFVFGSTTVEYIDAEMAQWRIFEAALTDAEVLAEMSSATAVKAGVWADYRMAAGAGRLNDQSGNARHLTDLNASITDGASDPPLFGPTINTQPVGLAVAVGASPTLTVAATTSGGTLTYQWQRQQGGAFSNVSGGSGATSAAYTLPVLTAADSGGYQCIVTDSNGSTTTTVASVTVLRHRKHWRQSYGAKARLKESPNPHGVAPNKTVRTIFRAAFFDAATSPDITLTLTGVAATSALGTLGPALSVPLTGIAAAGAVGALAPVLISALSGAEATTARGTFAPAMSVPLTGLEAASAIGTLTAIVPNPDVTVTLTGVAAVAAPGTFAPGTSVSLSGLEAATAVGTLTPSIGTGDITVTLVGVGAIGELGSLGPSTKLTLQGMAASVAAGALEPHFSLALTGREAVTAQGILHFNEEADAVLWNYVFSNGLTAEQTIVQTWDMAKQLVAGAEWDVLIEGGYSAGSLLKIMAAIAAGKTTIADHGDHTATVEFQAAGGTDVRVHAEMTGSERTDVTLTP